MRFWNIFSRGGFHPSNSLAIRETQNFSSPLQTPLQILKSPTGTAALFSLTSERRSYTVTDLLIFKLSRIKKCAIWRRDLDYDYYIRMFMYVYILYSVNFRFGAGGRRRSINLYEVAYKGVGNDVSSGWRVFISLSGDIWFSPKMVCVPFHNNILLLV